MRDGRSVGVFDSKSGSLLSVTYLPEKIKNVQITSPTEIVAYGDRVIYVLRRNGPTSNNFSIYMCRPI